MSAIAWFAAGVIVGALLAAFLIAISARAVDVTKRPE